VVSVADAVFTPAPAARVLPPDQIAYEAIQAGFPKEQIVTAVAVALAESKGNANALNTKPPDLSYGLWQINMYGSLGPARRQQFGISKNEDLFGTAVNARAAKMIYDGSGWRAWSTYKSGAYQAYILPATIGAASPKPTNVVSAEEQGGVHTEIDLMKPLEDFVDWLIKELGKPVLRVGMFVGGGILLIVAIVLYVRGEAFKTVQKAVT
jgi:hypothetical protein